MQKIFKSRSFKNIDFKTMVSLRRVFLLGCVLFTMPELALARGHGGEGSIVHVLQNIFALATGGVMRSAFCLFIVGCLYLAWINRLEWGYAIRGCIAAGAIAVADEIGNFLLNGI